MGAVQPGTRSVIDAGPIKTEPIEMFGKPEKFGPFLGAKGTKGPPGTTAGGKSHGRKAFRTSNFSQKFPDIFQYAPILFRKLNANPVITFRLVTPFYRALDN